MHSVLGLLFALILSSFPYLFVSHPRFTSNDLVSVESYYEDTDERAVLIDKGSLALKARLDLIESAQEEIHFSTFYFQEGKSSRIVLDALLQAANRGVVVNILLDGMLHGLRFEDRNFLNVVEEMPNINVRFYEPIQLHMPWRLHNRMHDKLLIKDNEKVLITGRNIADDYFDEYKEDGTYDRDLLIINDGERSPLIDSSRAYFMKLWQHEYVRNNRKQFFSTRNQRLDYISNLRDQARKTREMHNLFFDETVDWYDLSHPIDEGYFINNNLSRGYKDAVVYHHLLSHADHAERELKALSPFIIFTDEMLEDIREHIDLPGVSTLTTNGIYTTPNLVAYSGYHVTRPHFIEANISINEYQNQTQSLHQKSYHFDNTTIAIGSFNLDPRSAYINTESMFFIRSDSLIEESRQFVTKELASEFSAPLDEKDLSDDVKGKALLIEILSQMTRFLLPLL